MTSCVIGVKKVKKNLTPNTGHQYERLCSIIRRIQKGAQSNNRILAEEYGVRPRTIQRDMDFLRDRWALPLEYDPNRYTWYFTEPVTQFPLLPISEAELVSMFVAQKALTQYHGTPFEQPLKAAFDKLTRSLKGEISVAWADLDSAISFRSIDTKSADIRLFQQLGMAVRRLKEVRFKYHKLASSRFETRQVRPYHLVCFSNQWYLLAFDPMRQDMRTFALSRMKKLDVLLTTFKKPKDFSIDQFLKGSFGVFSGGASIEIRIWFDAWAARFIRERTWHHTQSIKRLRNAELELKLTLSSTVELLPWLLSWGNHARALSPNTFVDEVKDTVGRLNATYKVPPK